LLLYQITFSQYTKRDIFQRKAPHLRGFSFERYCRESGKEKKGGKEKISGFAAQKKNFKQFFLPFSFRSCLLFTFFQSVLGNISDVEL
jgi:hypothetical protein